MAKIIFKKLLFYHQIPLFFYYLNEENFVILSFIALAFNGFYVFAQNNSYNHKSY